VLPQQGTQLIGIDGPMTAPFKLVPILRVLEAESAESNGTVIDPMAVEMDHMVGALSLTGAVQCLAQFRQGRGTQELDHDLTTQLFHGLHQGQGTGAMVDIAAGVVFRAGADQQDADRGRHRRGIEYPRIGQAPAYPCRPGALEQEGLTVMQQLPGQAEQGGGRLTDGLCLLLGDASLRGRVDQDREAAAGAVADPRPGLQHIGGVLQRQYGLIELPAPNHQVLLDLVYLIPVEVTGPDGVVLQIPTQILGLDGP